MQFEMPQPGTAIGLTALSYAPWSILWLMRRRKKVAAIAFAAASLIAGIVFVQSRWTSVFLPYLTGCSALFLVPGVFWLWTAKRGWPTLIQPRSRSRATRVLIFAAVCVVVLCLNLVCLLTLTALRSSLYSGTCLNLQPFTRPRHSSHAVFTAKVLFAGRSLSTMRGPNIWPFPGAGDWAIGVVQERFWGTPPWTQLVLLTNNVYRKDETYFVDGVREQGVLTRFLPIVQGGVGCSRTRPVKDAIIDLHLLRSPSDTAAAARLIGCVSRPSSASERPGEASVIEGAHIQVTGPGGTTIATTDSKGVYELRGLAPGAYTLELTGPEAQVARWGRLHGTTKTLRLASGEIAERSWTIPN